MVEYKGTAELSATGLHVAKTCLTVHHVKTKSTKVSPDTTVNLAAIPNHLFTQNHS